MKYLTERLQYTYISLRQREDSLLELVNSGKDIGFKSRDLVNIIHTIEDGEERLRVAQNNWETISEISDENVKGILHPILSGSYEEHNAVVIDANVDYDKLSELLEERGDDVSCVVHHNGKLFDARNDSAWNKNVKPGDKIDIYHHNMNGIEYSLKEITDILGEVVEETNQGYIRDIQIVNIKSGLHARPITLLMKAIQQYQGEVIISKGEIEVDGKSILGVMALGSTCGTELIFRYTLPENVEQRKTLDEIKSEVKKILSGHYEVKNPGQEKKARALLRVDNKILKII